jgi:hypothetical protein
MRWNEPKVVPWRSEPLRVRVRSGVKAGSGSMIDPDGKP